MSPTSFEGIDVPDLVSIPSLLSFLLLVSQSSQADDSLLLCGQALYRSSEVGITIVHIAAIPLNIQTVHLLSWEFPLSRSNLEMRS